MSTEAETKLARARAMIRARAPYIMTTIYGLIPTWVPGLKTLGVSRGMVLAIDPDWFETIQDKHAAGALVHEAFHIINLHPERMDKFPDRELANIAGDLWINQIIRAAGWELPHGVYPEDFGFPEGLILEEYYQLLVKRKQAAQKQQQNKQKGPGQPQQGQGAGGQAGGGPKDQKQQGQGAGAAGAPQQPGQGQQAHGQGQQGQGSGNAPGQGQQPAQGQGGSGSSNLPAGKELGVCAGRCGGAGGNPMPFEKKLDEESGRSDADQARIVKQTVEEIRQHAAQHGRGSVPASLLQDLEIAHQQAEVRWQDECAHFMKKCAGRVEAGGMDYSLARPSKRSHARGFPRPGLVQYLPELCFILDTSASMGDKQIIDAATEAVGIFKALGIDSAWFLQADAHVAKTAKRVRMRDLLGSLKIHGRGGTNFDPALKAASKLKPRPDIIVYLTDGDGHVTYRPKGIEVIWCVVRNHWNREPPCDWGHTVIIADKAKDPITRTPRTR